MKAFFTFLSCLLLMSVQPVFGAYEYDSIKILVEDLAITKNEIEIRALELAQARTGKQPSSEVINEFRKEAVNQLIEETLLDAKADDLKIIIGEEELDEEISHFQSQRNISQVEFEELLERQNISLSDFRKNYLRQLRRNRLIGLEIRSKINISEESMKEAYETSENAEQLVRARHILLMVSKGATDEKVSQVKTKAIEIRNRIVNGEPFEKIADTYSEDPSVKNNHGDLGFFKKGDMVKEFAEAAFNLEKGQISEPVRSPFGYHLIEVTDIKKENREPFEAVKSNLMQQEFQKQFAERYSEYIKELKSAAKIIIK